MRHMHRGGEPNQTNNPRNPPLLYKDTLKDPYILLKQIPTANKKGEHECPPREPQRRINLVLYQDERITPHQD